MKVLIYTNDIQLSDEEIDKTSVILDIDEGEKGFTIERHIGMSNTRLYPKFCNGDPHMHMSHLKNILLAAKRKFKWKF